MEYISKLTALMEGFDKAIGRLQEVLEREKDDVVRDSSIQRFEFVFDLAWKTLKEFLKVRYGIISGSPKGCFREAYKQGLVVYDDFWIEITNMRNETAHSYNEATVEKVYAVLPKALAEFRVLQKAIREHLTD